MAALATIQDDFSSATLDTSKWTLVETNTGGSVDVVSGELVLDHNFDAAIGSPPGAASTAVWGATGQIANSSVYCRYKPLLVDNDGAGLDHAAWDTFAILNRTNLEGFGFIHAPTDSSGPGTMYCKVFNNINDEWWVDVGTISGYDPDGAHAWLRCRHAGTTFYWDTAPDDGTGNPGSWTQRFSYSQTGSGVSFDNMSGFLGASGSRILFRVHHWANEFDNDWIQRYPTIDGVNSPLVASVTHEAVGVIVGGGAALSGIAARNVTHSAAGVIVGGGGALDGAAARAGAPVSHAASGAIVGGGAVVTGHAGAPVTHEAIGHIVGDGAELDGSAAWTENTGKTYYIKDPFDGSSIDAGLWDVITIGSPTGGVSVSGGDLRISQTNNDLSDGYLVRAVDAKDFQASQVYTRLVNGLRVSNNQNGAEANFGVIDDTDSGYLWQQRSNGTLVPHWKVAGTPNDGPAFAYTPSTHAWLRIKEEGGTVYWQHAPATAQNPPANHQWVTDYSRTRAADGTFAINTVRVRFMVLMVFGTPGVPLDAVRFACVNMRTEASVVHAATGAIEGGGAALAGLAAKQVTHDASGAIVGAGATLEGSAARSFEHTATGAIAGGGAIISAESSTSDVTRRVWVDVQDTAGAWSDEPQSADPWTDVPPSAGTWGS